MTSEELKLKKKIINDILNNPNIDWTSDKDKLEALSGAYIMGFIQGQKSKEINSVAHNVSSMSLRKDTSRYD